MTALAILITVAALVGLALVVVRAWRRRIPVADAELVERRLAELRALPAPEELPRSPDLTPGMARKLRRRRHPIAHKRSGRPI